MSSSHLVNCNMPSIIDYKASDLSRLTFEKNYIASVLEGHELDDTERDYYKAKLAVIESDIAIVEAGGECVRGRKTDIHHSRRRIL